MSMSDTDVYRVMWRLPDQDVWYQALSNAHPHGLHTELKSARASVAQRKASRQGAHREYKIQKLGVATTSASKYFHIDVERVELEWRDVDA